MTYLESDPPLDSVDGRSDELALLVAKVAEDADEMVCDTESTDEEP